MGDLLRYARVSITAQNPQLQFDALTAVGCTRLFIDYRRVPKPAHLLSGGKPAPLQGQKAYVRMADSQPGPPPSDAHER